MRFSRRFINFAACIAVIAGFGSLVSCKGRTLDNVTPTGDTIEVVILQDTLQNSQTP